MKTFAVKLSRRWFSGEMEQMRQVEFVSSWITKIADAMLLISCLSLLAGCAEVIVSGTMAGGGEYYRYTTSNIAKETLVGDVREVTAATRSALKKMDIRLYSVTPYSDATEMIASTGGLDITIAIKPVTRNTTQVEIDAKEDPILKKDKATADEILSQIRIEMAGGETSGDSPSKVFVKNNCRSPIYVAVRFLGGSNEPEYWQTRGWFILKAGQKKHIADTRNRYVYFYAETRLKDGLFWGGDNYHWFEGRRFGFFRADFRNVSDNLTQSFNCD